MAELVRRENVKRIQVANEAMNKESSRVKKYSVGLSSLFARSELCSLSCCCPEERKKSMKKPSMRDTSWRSTWECDIEGRGVEEPRLYLGLRGLGHRSDPLARALGRPV